MFSTSTYTISLFVFLIFLAAIEYTNLYIFFRILKKPLRRVSVTVSSSLFPKTEKLLRSYEQVPVENRKLLKLYLETEDFSNTFANQVLDFFHKLVISVAIVGMTLATTVTIANLTFLKDNSDMKKNYVEWVKSINETMNSLKFGLDSFLYILGICVAVFVFACNHLFINSVKERQRKRHLKILDAVEEKS